MADRRAPSRFDRAQEIDDLLERRQKSSLQPRQYFGSGGANTLGHYVPMNSILRPYGPEWTGAQWQFDTGEIQPPFVVPFFPTGSSIGTFAVVKRVDGAWAIAGSGLGAATIQILGPNSSSPSTTFIGVIAGATVTLTLANGQTFSDTTDGTGSVTFHGVARSTGTLTASVTGFNSGSWSVSTSSSGGTCTVTGGPFQLTPTAIPSPIVVTVFSGSQYGAKGWISGYPVVIKDPGGTTVFSGATNASGQVSYTPVTTGTFHVSLAANGRWAGTGSIACLVNGSGSAQIGARPSAAGPTYVDVFPNGSCVQPIKNSLVVTDSVIGSFTATYNGNSSSQLWTTGLTTYNFPGSADENCPAVIAHMQYLVQWINGQLGLQVQLAQTNTLLGSNVFGGGGSAGGNGCPSSNLANFVTLFTRIIGNFTVACPTSFSASLTLPANYTKRCDSSFKKLYGDALPTYTITESP